MPQKRRRRTKILVPLDGSAAGEAALVELERVIAMPRMALTLLRVVDPINPAPLLRDEAGARLRLAGRRGEAARYLDAVRRRLERRGIPARIVVRAGDPAQEILDYARSREMDLIAMSTHGRTGLRRAVFGSVAEAVGRQALVPVLLVRSQPGRKTPSRAR